jgi:hypothetical protein
VALAAIAERLSSWTTIAAEVEIASRPNPEAAPETVYGSAVQQPLDHACRWEWSVVGREWLELVPITRPGQANHHPFAYAISPNESWEIHFDAEKAGSIRDVVRWGRAIVPPERASSVILPAALGLCVPGIEHQIIDLLERTPRPALIFADQRAVVDFGAVQVSSRNLYVEASFAPDRQWSLSNISVRDPGVQPAPRRDGSTVEQQTTISVDQWRRVEDEATQESIWFPERVTRTTSAGIHTMQLRKIRVGFPSDELRRCPNLPFGTPVQDMGTGAHSPVRLYLVGGETALDVRMEQHVAAARKVVDERDRTGQRFDGRSETTIGWPKWALFVSLLLLVSASVWRWLQQRAR